MPQQLAASRAPGPGRVRLAGLAVAALLVGLAVLVVGLVLTFEAAGGRPWRAGLSGQDGVGHAEIVFVGGGVETFDGPRADARAWLDRRQAQLRQKYALDEKLSVGRDCEAGGGSVAALALVSVLVPAPLRLWRSRAAS